MTRDTVKMPYLQFLNPSLFNEAELQSYATEFTGADDPDSGKAMLHGIRALEVCLRQVDQNSVIILIIG